MKAKQINKGLKPPAKPKKKKGPKFERQSWTVSENKLYLTFLR